MNVRQQQAAEDAARKVARSEFWLRVVTLVLAALLVGALATVVVLAGQIRDTQMEGTPLGKQLATSSGRILDCTEASGTCYRENQKRTAALLRQVLGDNIVVAVCATAVPTDLPLDLAIERVTTCVLEQRSTKP